MKRMLFNATHAEELRVAIVDGQKLLDLDIESTVRHQKKGNIYKGIVTRVEPSLEAAFVDYGAERQGFLPLKEISRAYFTDYSSSTPMAQVRIQDVIKEDQEFLVQVEKDERGNKGAALTTFISLAGRFLVLMPNNPKGGGISRRIEGEERTELRDAMAQLAVPNEHALIARTAGIGKSFEELQWDLDYLLQLWSAIEGAASERDAPFLVYQESNLVVRAIRDYLKSDIAEIIIDDRQIYERASKFMQQVMPHNLVKLKLYEDSIPLFSRFQIEHQIEAAFSREVRLSSGGALVIDPTEAVVTIDVNSARSTKGADIEETALQTNLEAVDEIARQLRIRDIGGLIVIDLIDMTSSRNQRLVESRLQDALKSDRARVQVGRISRFGLLEMSRQRLRSSLGESNYLPCPRCQGAGHIRAVPSAALSILRILEEEALKENTEAIHAHLPIATATFLLNEKRHELNMIEKRLATRIVVIPTAELETPQFRVKRLRSDDLGEAEPVSYQIELEQEETEYVSATLPVESAQRPAVAHEKLQSAPPPVSARTEKSPGLLRRILAALTATEKTSETKAAPESPSASARRAERPRRRPHGGSARRSQRGPRDDSRRAGRSGRPPRDAERRPAEPSPAREAPEQEERREGARPQRSRGGGRRGRAARGGSEGRGGTQPSGAAGSEAATGDERSSAGEERATARSGRGRRPRSERRERRPPREAADETTVAGGAPPTSSAGEADAEAASAPRHAGFEEAAPRGTDEGSSAPAAGTAAVAAADGATRRAADAPASSGDDGNGGERRSGTPESSATDAEGERPQAALADGSEVR